MGVSVFGKKADVPILLYDVCAVTDKLSSAKFLKSRADFITGVHYNGPAPGNGLIQRRGRGV